MRAIQITEFGGPEVLRVVDLPEPEAQAGQLLLDVSAAGVNYADTHAVEDSYLSKSTLPMVPGGEVVGHTAEGRRVVALTGDGGYAQRALAAEAMAHDLPEGITDGQALALVVQGLTAWHLLRTSARIAPGESVVVHAAAGWDRVAGRAARQGVRRGAGDRHRLVRGEAGAGAGAGRRRRDRGRPRRRGPQGGADRGERRGQGRHRPRNDRWPGLRRLARGARPVR